ncbi:M15 family metallopeptidase [Arthrobacter crystallopoietes]|uniref:M15 family metallopeptidase n=1 Tax=Crystallibacter crystallopoietes TaxID=37928 RepID=UPI001FC93D99|nr:M15 family metallopeptidase [Arthrobacter crystallopoietes]
MNSRTAIKTLAIAAAIAVLTGCAGPSPEPSSQSTTASSSVASSPSPSGAGRDEGTAAPEPGETSVPETDEPQARVEPEETEQPGEPEEPDQQADQPGAEGHDDPASIDVVVNKTRPLEPADYYPADLRSPNVTTGPGGAGAQLRAAAAGAAEEMFAAAAAEGVGMTIVSGFRSYDTQVSTYQHWVNVNGKAGADEVSARPGYSEHQTGLALDIGDSSGACNLSACFADTAAGSWAAQNAHRFGFVVRYQSGQQDITGYSPEPWHLRFIGKADAADMYNSGAKALETYYGLPAAPDYL